MKLTPEEEAKFEKMTFEDWLRNTHGVIQLGWIGVVVLVGVVTIPVFNIGGVMVTGILVRKTWRALMMHPSEFNR